jgi:hypothetical protein
VWCDQTRYNDHNSCNGIDVMKTMKEGDRQQKKVSNRKDTFLDYFNPMLHFKWNGEAEECLLIKSIK